MQYFLEKLSEGLIVSLIGIGATFVIMALLILFIIAFKYMFIYIENIKNNSKPKIKDKPKITEKPQTETETIKEYEGIAPQVIAAITAAVNCCLDAENKVSGIPKAGFIVRKIMKIS